MEIETARLLIRSFRAHDLHDYAAIVDRHRQWLAELPSKVAKAIAYGNAVRLYGTGGVKALAR